MPIKEYSKDASQVGDDWQGAWGSIAPTPHSATTLCLRRNREVKEHFSYPYHGISRWSWKAGQPETLEILAGKDRVKLHGIGLQRLLEALNTEQLELLVENVHGADQNQSMVIQSIQIEPLV